VDVHHVANHQWTAFMTTQHAGRERPGYLQLPDVGGVDLIELGIACVGVVALLHDPVLGVLGQLIQRLVGPRRKTLQGHEAEDRSRND